jgi:hypothetical protein
MTDGANRKEDDSYEIKHCYAIFLRYDVLASP